MKKITSIIVLLLISFSCYAFDTEAPTKPTNLTIDYQIGYLSWTSSTDNVGVIEYDIYVNDTFRLTVNHLPNATNGRILYELGPFTYQEIYTFKVLARDAAGNESIFSHYASYVADAPDDIHVPNQIFISRVMNGDNDNRAIEVLNTSGIILDMSEYNLKISYNGNTTWDATYTFPPNTSLYSFEKIRIGHSGLDLPYCNASMDPILNGIDFTNDIITSFDGNDVIGLFHNGVLIDRLGHLGEDATYVEDNRMVFRSFYVDQHTPWTNLDIDESTNLCSDILGEEYYLLSTPEVTAKIIAIYPNPIKGNTLQFKTKSNQTIDTVTIVDMNGRTISTSASITNNQLNIQNIKQGIYFIKIQSDNRISIHKMIRN